MDQFEKTVALNYAVEIIYIAAAKAKYRLHGIRHRQSINDISIEIK
jgi:hypothetical protein